MIRYFNFESEIFAVELGQEDLIQIGWVELTPAEVDEIENPVLTTEQQAVIDLNAAGVTTNTVEAALYLDHRGNSAPITAIDASIDAVVISSGLTLSTVSNLI